MDPNTTSPIVKIDNTIPPDLTKIVDANGHMSRSVPTDSIIYNLFFYKNHKPRSQFYLADGTVLFSWTDDDGDIRDDFKDEYGNFIPVQTDTGAYILPPAHLNWGMGFFMKIFKKSKIHNFNMQSHGSGYPTWMFLCYLGTLWGTFSHMHLPVDQLWGVW